MARMMKVTGLLHISMENVITTSIKFARNHEAEARLRLRLRLRLKTLGMRFF